jgi:xanthine dehydrogenase accessory factor
MTTSANPLKAFLDRAGEAVMVEVVGVAGSTPREPGAYMLVATDLLHGTIGGGHLEYIAIDKAREILRSPFAGSVPVELDLALGPEIGQCCGGRVRIAFRPVDRALAANLLDQAEAQDRRMPQIYLFGGGHVGNAMARALALLPVRVTVVETRASALEDIPPGVASALTPVPEAVVREAPAGAAFVILTHDHALDFLIAAEALKCGAAAYVGMIGSKTKRATFRSWFLKSGGGTEAGFRRLVSPIGGDAVKDKRPAVIAALAAAEVMAALDMWERQSALQPATL